MQLVATYDFRFGLRDREEIIRRGDNFTAPGTGISNAAEHGRSLIATGAAMTPEAWAKRSPKIDANHEALKRFLEANH